MQPNIKTKKPHTKPKQPPNTLANDSHIFKFLQQILLSHYVHYVCRMVERFHAISILSHQKTAVKYTCLYTFCHRLVFEEHRVIPYQSSFFLLLSSSLCSLIMKLTMLLCMSPQGIIVVPVSAFTPRHQQFFTSHSTGSQNVVFQLLRFFAISYPFWFLFHLPHPANYLYNLHHDHQCRNQLSVCFL